MLQDQDADEYSAVFCRALYDYKSEDPSALSLRAGDIIEILTKQPSGWWDGLLRDARGWFPSNYVEIISEEEADQAFSRLETLTEYTDEQPGDWQSPRPDIIVSIKSTDVETETLSRNGSRPVLTTSTTIHNNIQQSDFWVPEVTTDGQIYYINTETGLRSRDLPNDTEQEISDNELLGLISSRLDTSADPAFGLDINLTSIVNIEEKPRGSELEILTSLDSIATSALTSGRVNNTSFFNTSPPHISDVTNNGAYPNDPNTQPSESSQPSQKRQINGSPPFAVDSFLFQSQNNEASVTQMRSDERVAEALQRALEPQPPSPNLIVDLSHTAQDAIRSVIKNIQSSRVTRSPEVDKIMDRLVYNVVLAVRNLLYIAAALPINQTSEVPSMGSPRNTGPLHLSQPLKAHQRRVTAILSRLVLSARALVYNSGSSLADTVNRIQNDAEELLKDVHKFVADAQLMAQSHHVHENTNAKRLQGVFSVADAGLGLVGGGSAASWKGFGYHDRQDNSIIPPKTLSVDVVSEIDFSVDQLHMRLSVLQEALRSTAGGSVYQVCSTVQDLITHTSTFLSLIADVYVARHVDVDGTRHPAESSATSIYFRMVVHARHLVRYMEAVVQAIYDDSSSLLLMTQTLQEGAQNVLNSEREEKYELLNGLTSSLDNNFLLIKQIFGGLLSLGSQQAHVVQGELNASVDWEAHDDPGLPLGTNDHQVKDQEMVDLEFGFQQIGIRKQNFSGRDIPHDSFPISTFSGLSESSINAVETKVRTNIHEGEDVIFDGIGHNEAIKTHSRPAASAKLQRLLGDEYAEKVAADLRPWYLRPNYAASDIIIDADNSVRGGTLSALVERLTAHDQADATFTKAFLLTYKSYTTLDQLFDLLVSRFRIEQPEKLTQPEKEEWIKMKQHVIRTRVINTMKTIVDSTLEQEDLYILDRMKAFISSDEVSGSAAAKHLLVQIERTIRQGDTKTLINTNQEPPPVPIGPKTSKKLQLLDIDPLELARQFTIFESRLYQKIKPMEALQRARVQRVEHDDNIAAVIQTSNRIAEWIAECILSKEDARRRAQVIKHLITVADRCRALNNFSTMSAITSGLNTPPIRRLKRTWEQVNQRHVALFEACEMTIDSAKIFTKYKSLMTSVVPPCVPFLGVFLSTLQFIQDGNPDYLSDAIINFRKFQKASEIIIEIKRWQTQSYNLQPLPAVIAYITDSLNKFSGNTRALSDYFWALSLEREPREREDEKMARLLQESGF